MISTAFANIVITSTFNLARQHSRNISVARSRSVATAMVKGVRKKGVRSPKRVRAIAVKKEELVTTDIEDVVPYVHEPTPPDSETALRILQHLRDAFGRRTLTSKSTDKPVLDSLIHTLLTQATSDVNSDRAFAALKKAYPTWDQVLAAPVTDVADAIRTGGLANQKSIRIQNILRTLSETQHGLSLEYMRDMDTEEIKRVLNTFPGVGAKTIAVVLMCCLARAEFPVDTHVRRICGRLGWTKLKETPDNVYAIMNKSLDADVKYELHMLFIAHGRRFCKAPTPKCNECPLTEDCHFYRQTQQDIKSQVKVKDEDEDASFTPPKKAKVIKEEQVELPVPSVVFNTRSRKSTRATRSRPKVKDENVILES